MIIGIIVLILSVLEFIRSFKVHGNDTVLQKIYYYIGGMQVCLFGYGCYGLSSMVIIITIWKYLYAF